MDVELTADVPLSVEVSGMPRTVVVSARGEVMQIFNGRFSGDQEREVESFFCVALPNYQRDVKD